MSDKFKNENFDTKKLIINQRKQLKLSLRDLSLLTTFSYQTLSKYETGLIELSKTNRDQEIKRLILQVRIANQYIHTQSNRNIIF